MKIYEGGWVTFMCDACGNVASSETNEDKARKKAETFCKRRGWYYAYEGAVIYCPRCQGKPNGGAK